MVSGLKLNGILFNSYPNSFEELSGRVFQRIYSSWDLDKPILDRDYFKLSCIISDKAFDRIERTPENEAAMEALTSWVLNTVPQFKVVTSITIAGKEIPIPQNIGALPIGQTLLLRAAMDKTKYLEENICFACAVYLQPLLDNAKPNLESIKRWELEFEKLPITEIYSVGFFLLDHARKNFKRQLSVWLLIKLYRVTLRAKALRIWRRLTGYKGLIINHS